MTNQNLSQTPAIKFNNHKKIPFHRLPFVSPSRNTVNAKFWSLPLQGGYGGGYQAGAAMAEAFLKHFRQNDNDLHNELTIIVGSMMQQFASLDGLRMDSLPVLDQSDAYHSFRGQYVGFFNALTSWIAEHVRIFGQNLDQLSERELIKRAKEGLSKTETYSLQ